MAVLPIIRLGDPVLRAVAEPVHSSRFGSRELKRLVDDMIATMRAASGVGLAAPQVGRSIRLFVFESNNAEPPIPTTVAINPEVELLGDEPEEGWEGCLSIPELRGLVPRAPALRLSALDVHGQPFERQAAGFEARIIQHELDHLDGIVYLDRMTDLGSLGYAEELDAAEEALEENGEDRAAAESA